jgi:gas vesicle protein
MKAMDFFKGMGVGLMVGSALGVAMMPTKKTKSVVAKCMRSMGNIIDDVSQAMGW